MFRPRFAVWQMQIAVGIAFAVLASAQSDPLIPLDGLVSFWDFQEESGPFVSKKGRGQYELQGQFFDKSTRTWRSDNEGINRTPDSPPGQPFGPRAAGIGKGQLLTIPNTIKTSPLLDIRGDNATLSMVAWTKPSGSDNDTDCFGHVAGIWAEPISVRQYVLFGSHCRAGDKHLNDAEVSRTGSTHPPCKWSISYALGSTHMDDDAWHMVAMTFDGQFIRSYVNGTLDYRAPHRIHDPSDPCNETWQNPASVSTWSNRSSWGPGGDPLAPENHTDFAVGGQKGAEEKGYPLGHQWTGKIGGLAVYDRALTADELQKMADSSMGLMDAVPQIV